MTDQEPVPSIASKYEGVVSLQPGDVITAVSVEYNLDGKKAIVWYLDRGGKQCGQAWQSGVDDTFVNDYFKAYSATHLGETILSVTIDPGKIKIEFQSGRWCTMGW